jgi:hypothetical protein
MLLEGGLDWKPMGFSPSDVEIQKTKDAAAGEIAIAFGVPPMILGIPGDANYANYQEANRAFYRLTVLPLATRVTQTLSDWLSDFTGERIALAPISIRSPPSAMRRSGRRPGPTRQRCAPWTDLAPAWSRWPNCPTGSARGRLAPSPSRREQETKLRSWRA